MVEDKEIEGLLQSVQCGKKVIQDNVKGFIDRLSMLNQNINDYICSLNSSGYLSNVTLRYIILHLGNAATLSKQIVILQQEQQNIGSFILARSIFEECAIIHTLEAEYKGEKLSNYYKYLVIKDMYQDLTIMKKWKKPDIDYFNRIANLLHTYFKEELSGKPLPTYSTDRVMYSEREFKLLYNTVMSLKKVPKKELCKCIFY